MAHKRHEAIKRLMLLFVVAASSTMTARAEDVLVAEYSGQGVQITRPFTVDGPWEVQWSANESLLFQIFLKQPGEAENAPPKALASQNGKGSGSSYVERGGTYYLEVMGLGTWRIKVVSIK